MKAGEKGFTLLETAIVVALSASLALSTSVFTFHAFSTTERNNDRLTAVTSAENAGYWLSRDASMADSVTVDNLTAPDFLILKWTEWGYDEDNVYYSVTYSIDNVTDGIGRLTRRLQNSSGIDQSMQIASNIYYDGADPDNSTNVTSESPSISFRVATRHGSASEMREYRVHRRPNF